MTKFEEELSSLPVSKSTNYAEYWNKAQLLTVFKDWQPQQALPVVPECVAEWIEILKTKGLKPLKNPETYGETGFTEEKLQNIVFWISEHQEDYMRAWLDGYQVEKPQLFKLIFPNSTAVLQKDGELNSFADTVYKRYLIENAMTEQEIKSIDERYWQFAVPVEDGE
ncbi:DUF1642 domain-containing protein [Lactococcus lactis]|uniref:DUF1642 domain-containing protein n=1 Tax=Lactococcus lactis TaxID=1358 RepID=UPI0013CAEA57|nr:DUF1642 domain-containing protein [Lactococcus lactis]NEX58688.1 DUF1642 domain-containing protein [Lactococcus lactis]